MALGVRPSCSSTVRTSRGSSSGLPDTAPPLDGRPPLHQMWLPTTPELMSGLAETLLAGLDRAPPQLGVPRLVLLARHGRGVHLFIRGRGHRRCGREVIGRV